MQLARLLRNSTNGFQRRTMDTISSKSLRSAPKKGGAPMEANFVLNIYKDREDPVSDEPAPRTTSN